MSKNKLDLNMKNRINLFRTENKISQEELANQIGVTRATINAIERGNYNPSLELAFKIARHFKTDIQSIFYIQVSQQDLAEPDEMPERHFKNRIFLKEEK